MASGSTSAHSIQRRPGKSQKETSAASAVPSTSTPAPTPTSSTAVAASASGTRPEKRDRLPGAATNESGRPISGPAPTSAGGRGETAQPSIPRLVSPNPPRPSG